MSFLINLFAAAMGAVVMAPLALTGIALATVVVMIGAVAVLRQPEEPKVLSRRVMTQRQIAERRRATKCRIAERRALAQRHIAERRRLAQLHIG